MKTSQHSQRGEQKHVDVLIIGSGIAGLSYALQVAQREPHIKIALISKAELKESNSYYAQGGIAAAESHSIASHVQDTLSAGDGLCYQPTVEKIITQSADVILFLQKQGVEFTLDQQGKPS